MADYSKFANAAGCGYPKGTAQSGPRICGKTPKYRTDAPHIVINGRVCGIHARSVGLRGYTVTPLTEVEGADPQ